MNPLAPCLYCHNTNKMPPNLKGGKNYKKMKHDQGAKPDLHDIGEGQMIGRVMRLLGNRQGHVYCNDGVERLCRIRGALRKRVWIGTGDIVLISLRTYTVTADDESDDDLEELSSASLSSAKKGDILAKYDPEVYSKLKKIDGVNKKLFGALDGVNAARTSKGYMDEEDDDLFDADATEETPDKEDDDDANAPKKTPWKRSSSTAKSTKDSNNDDVDIDAI